MPNLINIGHSQGIAIPNTFIEQAHLKNGELQFKVVTEGLLISPVLQKSVRKGWKDSIEATLIKNGQEIPDNDWLNAPLVTN